MLVHLKTIREGLGTFTFSDGTIIKGIWKNDEFVEELN